MMLYVVCDSYNAYDQYGDYYRDVYLRIPTLEELRKYQSNISEKVYLEFLSAMDLVDGFSFRRDHEDYWIEIYKEEGIK